MLRDMLGPGTARTPGGDRDRGCDYRLWEARTRAQMASIYRAITAKGMEMAGRVLRLGRQTSANGTRLRFINTFVRPSSRSRSLPTPHHTRRKATRKHGRERQTVQAREREGGQRARPLRVRQQVPHRIRLARRPEPEGARPSPPVGMGTELTCPGPLTLTCAVAPRAGRGRMDPPEPPLGPVPRHRGRGQGRHARGRAVRALPVGHLAGRGGLLDLQVRRLCACCTRGREC